MSFALSINKFGFNNYSLYREFHELIESMDGTVFVAAAGNNKENVGNNIVPAALTTDFTNKTEYFPGLDNVITVGSVDYNLSTGNPGDFSYFSNYGDTVTLGAPGDNVRVVDINESDGYSSLSGTSFAAPLVSGTVALIRALYPTVTPLEIKSLLEHTGKKNHSVYKDKGNKQKLPVLDAGAAVEAVTLVAAEIRSEDINLKIHPRPDCGYLSILVTNTGSHTWLFQIEGSADSNFASNKIKSQRLYVPPGSINPIKLYLCANKSGKMSGKGKVRFEIYQVADFTSPRDPTAQPLDTKKKLTVEIVVATPTPAPTATPPATRPAPAATPRLTNALRPANTPAPAAVPSTGTSPETDREALVALYNATGGRDWVRNDNWLSDAPIGEWYGIATDADSHVTQILLKANQLNGEIPPELNQLTRLEILELGDNQLTGEIPPELGNLVNLIGLWLYGNALSGEIPSELGNLASLVVLVLDGGSSLIGFNSGNSLSGEMPPELGNLVNLRMMSLKSHRLSGEIPRELGNLVNLEVLNLDINDLSGGIPPELGNLSNLRELHLQLNRLGGRIPPELGNLANLEVLIINGNSLTGEVPSELGYLTNLIYLNLGSNQLRGCIPNRLQYQVESLKYYANTGGLPLCAN